MNSFPSNPRIAVVGSGALGCYYGGRLVQHGHDVHFLMRSDFDHVHAHGLHIQSHAGDFDLAPDQLRVYRDPANMPPADLVIVTLKATANHAFPSLISPLLADHTAILTLQNGLGNEQQLADLFGQQRIIGGLAFACINRIAPGQILHTDYGLIKIGEFGRPPSPRLQTIAQLFQGSNIPCEILADLNAGRWEKLIWNVPFNALGAALNVTTDRLINNPAGQTLVRQIMEEVIAIAHADGVNLDPALIDKNINRSLTMGPYRTSMQMDRQNHRPIELQSILGQPLQVARTHALATPHIQMLYQLLATQIRSLQDPVIE